jgi:hypothetical protein
MSVLAVLGIAKTLGITDWISNKLSGSDNDAAKVASKVLDFASQATGESNPLKIEKALSNDPKLAAELKATLMANEHEINMAPYKDRQGARGMHNKHPEQADKIADRIMKYNPVYIAICLICQAFALYFMRDNPELLALLTSVLTMATKSFFDERKDVTGFFYGSSMGSKSKDINSQFRGSA